MAAKILLIEDDESFANSVRLMLRDHPVDITWAETGTQGIQAYRKNTMGYATVIVDYMLPDQRGTEVAQQLRKINPVQDVLFASGFRDPEYLTAMLEAGFARTFIQKGRSVEEVRGKILDSIAVYENKNRVLGHDEVTSPKAEIDLKKYGFIGRSSQMQRVIELIRKFRHLPYGVLIVGETGTGKEKIAQALAADGKKIVSLHCPEFTANESRMESDLFGHVKGAFTGADQTKPGLLLQAHGQVLFLDELHTLSFTAQQKLLKVLEAKSFRKMGDEKGVQTPVDFRIISAAKPEIHQLMKEERFLLDLFHRVGKLEIHAPALRDRPEDIEPLVRHYQDQVNKELPANEQRQFRISTIREMEKYSWPGNVRELESAVCFMMTTIEKDIVSPADFDAYLSKHRNSVQSCEQISMTSSVQKLEREKIIAALKSSRTLIEAAAKIGISRWALMRRLDRFGINAEAYLLGA